MNCSQCGAQLPNDAAFCHVCGARVVSPEKDKGETAGSAGSSTPQEAGTHTKSGYCQRCGHELGVNEKMRGLTVHEKCPTPAPEAPPEPAAAQEEALATAAPTIRVRARADAPRGRYAGASTVAPTLWILGWLIAILGVIGAIAGAAVDPCEQYDVCDGEGAIRLASFVGTLIAAWLVATGVLWAAYMLRLLSDIEGRLRGDSE